LTRSVEGSEALGGELKENVLIFLNAWRTQEEGVFDNGDG
jgi:hypothetical protein